MSLPDKTILVADDSNEIREVLQILLEGENYHVLLARNGTEALSMAEESVDLFILDVNMPDKSGFSVSAQIRKISYAPILFLTARSQESDMALGYSSGGDDYLTKPFSNAQLLLRIKALLRRYGSYNDASARPPVMTKIRFGDLVIDTDTQQVMLLEKRIQLTHTEYKILELLAVNRKKIFSLDHIYSSIWDRDVAVGDNAIMVHVKNLRKKLEPQGDIIKTAWGKGYYID